jgi:hypothetical protein
LEGYLGAETMARVMRTYHERWRFRHPSSEDFFRVASEISGQDLSWFFDQTVRGTGILDYAIASVSSNETQPPYGVLDRKGGRTTVSSRSDEKRSDPKRTSYDSTVLVQRKGEIVFPVTLALHYEGGRVERRTWDGRDRWTKIRTTTADRLAWAEIDPERRILLDVDWLNNARRVEPDSRASTRWSSRIMFWIQNVVAMAMGF